MKFVWRNNIGDLAAWNSVEVEEVGEETKKYADMLAVDGEQSEWEEDEDHDELEFVF